MSFNRDRAFEAEEGILVYEGAGVFSGSGSPVGSSAPLGSMYLRVDDGSRWEKFGAGDNDWRLLPTKVPNLLVVRPDAPPGEYSSLKAALDDTPETGTWVIQIAPGTYTEDNTGGPLLLKGNATVKALGHGTVTIQPQDPNTDLFLADESSARLQGITITGVTGACAVRVASSPLPIVLDFVTMTNCQQFVCVDSTAAVSQAVLRNLRLISGATTTHFIKITATDGFASTVRIYSAIMSDDDGTAFVAGLHLSGTGARIEPNTVLMRSSVGVGSGMHVEDGANVTLTSGMEVSGFDKGLYVPNTGAAPSLFIASLSMENETLDIDVDHVSAQGAIICSHMDDSKVENAAAGTLTLSFVDHMTGDYLISGLLTARGWSPQLSNVSTDGETKVIGRSNPHTIVVTGDTAGTVIKLDDATTFTKAGIFFDIWNLSTQPLNITNYADTILATLKPNGRTQILLRDKSTEAGLWGVTYTLDSGNVFGTNILLVTDATETSNNSGTTWANKLTLTTPGDLPLGDYLLNFQFIWRASANREADFRFQRDAVNVLTWQPSVSRGQDRPLLSGFIRLDELEPGTDLTFDFKYANSSTTIFVREARMFIWRIA